MAVPSIKEDKSSCGSRLQQWCRSRNCQLWRLLLLPFIPILALIVQTTLSLENSVTNGREVADVEEQVSRATELGKLVTRLQQERSEVAFFIFTNGSTLRSNLTQRFAGTDSAILQMGDLPFLIFKSRVDPVSGIQFLAELSELSPSLLLLSDDEVTKRLHRSLSIKQSPEHRSFGAHYFEIFDGLSQQLSNFTSCSTIYTGTQ